jgi:YbbR domain-containing protein
MKWITEDWRLKLLALGLAVLMLGAVAFAQNPPTTKTLSVGLTYAFATGSAIVITNPPSKTTVTVTGVADVIALVTPNNLTATADATHAKPGSAVKLNVTVASSVEPVNVQNPAPIVVNVDRLVEKDLTVNIIAQEAPGFHIDTGKTATTCQGVTPCVVHFTGPQSWEDPVALSAVVIYSPPVNLTDIRQPSQPIVLETNSGPFDVSRVTQPSWELDIKTADIHIVATPGSNSSTVPLVDAVPTHLPPSGYHIVGVTTNPATVVITGDPAALGKVQRITLPAVDLSSYTSTVTIKVQIPYPSGVTPLNGVATASITYQIVPDPAVSPGG